MVEEWAVRILFDNKLDERKCIDPEPKMKMTINSTN